MSERAQLRLMLAPYALGALLLFFAPAVYSLALALTDADLLTPAQFIGLDNFRELAADDIFAEVLWNSALFVLIAVPLRLFIATALALALHARARGAGAGRTAGFLPTVVPDAAWAMVWLFLLNPIYGPVNAAARRVRHRAGVVVLGRRRRVRGDRADDGLHGRRGVHRRARRPPGAARRAVRGRASWRAPARGTCCAPSRCR